MMKYVDVVQVGARNMQNFELLKCVGRMGKPVLLKRGLSGTIEEWLMSAEYILSEGNHQVVLCERGIRTFEPYTRNTLDLSAIPVLKKLTHLPIIVDPSHATGMREKVSPMARSAIAAGADGLMIEVHHDPDHALSDGAQSLYPQQFRQLMRDIYVIAPVIGKQLDFAHLERVQVIERKRQKRQRAPAGRASWAGSAPSATRPACSISATPPRRCRCRPSSPSSRRSRRAGIDYGDRAAGELAFRQHPRKLRPAAGVRPAHHRRGEDPHHAEPAGQARHGAVRHPAGALPSPGVRAVPPVSLPAQLGASWP